MSIKDWKNGEIKTLLTEAWGFQMDLSKLNEGADDASEKDDDDTGTNPYGTKKDGSPEHHMGTGEGRGTHESGAQVNKSYGDELEEVGGVGSGALDPRDRRKPHGTGRPVDDKAKKKKDDELEEDSFPGKRDMEQHKSDLSERQKRIQALVQKALKEAIKKRKG